MLLTLFTGGVGQNDGRASHLQPSSAYVVPPRRMLLLLEVRGDIDIYQYMYKTETGLDIPTNFLHSFCTCAGKLMCGSHNLPSGVALPLVSVSGPAPAVPGVPAPLSSAWLPLLVHRIP